MLENNACLNSLSYELEIQDEECINFGQQDTTYKLKYVDLDYIRKSIKNEL